MQSMEKWIENLDEVEKQIEICEAYKKYVLAQIAALAIEDVDDLIGCNID